MTSPAARKLTAKPGVRTGACGAGMHDYCPANHTPQSCACTCHQEEDALTYTREHLYTVQARRGGNGSWNQIMRATTSSEAYAYAKQCAEEARSAGENNIDYRVVQTDADGAKIAQIVTPDGLGDLNPLNLLWIEKMEREDAARVTDTAVGTSSACVTTLKGTLNQAGFSIDPY